MTTDELNERKVYMKKSNKGNVVVNIFCFLCGVVIGLIIAVPFMF